MRQRNAVLLGLVALVVVFYAGGSTVHYFGRASFDQPIVIQEFSTDGKADWVRLYNRTDEPYSLAGMVLSDGGNTFSLPDADQIPAMGTFTVASSRDKKKLKAENVEVDAYWEGWGINDNEIILVYNENDRSIVDYYIPQKAGMGAQGMKSAGVLRFSEILDLLEVFEHLDGAWSALLALAGWFARRLWPDSAEGKKPRENPEVQAATV